MEISHRRPGARAAQPPAVNLPEFSALVCTWPGGEAVAGGGALAPQVSRTDCRQTSSLPSQRDRGQERGQQRRPGLENKGFSVGPHTPKQPMSPISVGVQGLELYRTPSLSIALLSRSLLPVFTYLQKAGGVGRWETTQGTLWESAEFRGLAVVRLVPWVPSHQSFQPPRRTLASLSSTSWWRERRNGAEVGKRLSSVSGTQ